MNHSSKFKRRLLSASFLVFSTALAAGCGFDTGHVFGDMFGNERTVPDGADVDFSNRHSPILNPSTKDISRSAGESMNEPAPMAPSSSNGMSQHASSSGYAGSSYASASAAQSVPFTPAPGRHVPVENQSVLAANSPASMNAPVAPVMATNMMNAAPAGPSVAGVVATPLPVTGASSPAMMAEATPRPSEPAPMNMNAQPMNAQPMPAPTAMNEPAPMASEPAVKPAHTDNAPAPTAAEATTSKSLKQTKMADDGIPAPVASGDLDLSGSANPSLASIPPAPEVPSKAENTAQFNSLASDQHQSETSRQDLMNNPNATVMTSPTTGQMVDNAAIATAPAAPAAMAAPSDSFAPVTNAESSSQLAQANASAAQPAKQESGFNHWLHNLFHKDDSGKQTASTQPAGMNTPAEASANPPRDPAPTPGGAATAADTASMPVTAPVPGGSDIPASPMNAAKDDMATAPVLTPPSASSSDTASTASAPAAAMEPAKDVMKDTAGASRDDMTAPVLTPPAASSSDTASTASAPAAAMEPAKEAMKDSPASTAHNNEVAPNVIAGVAPPFPPAQPSQAESFAQPVPAGEVGSSLPQPGSDQPAPIAIAPASDITASDSMKSFSPAPIQVVTQGGASSSADASAAASASAPAAGTDNTAAAQPAPTMPAMPATTAMDNTAPSSAPSTPASSPAADATASAATPAPATTDNAASTASAAPAAPAAAENNTASTAAPAPAATADNTSSTATTPATGSAPANVTPQAAMDASMQPGAATAATSKSLEPVQLTPPSALESTNVSTLPDINQLAGAKEEPVSLVPPSELNAPAQQPRYLSDSRYASRRNDESGN